MELEGYIFSDQLERLYQETINTVLNSRLRMTAEDNITYEEGAYGAFFLNDNSGENIIQINRRNINEHIISHELLHCYFSNKGYPKLKLVGNNNDLISRIGQNIENCLIHKLIYEEQDKRDINYEIIQEEFALSLGNNRPHEPDDLLSQLIFSFKILEAEIRCGGYKHIYADRIKSNFSNSYKIAMRLYDRALQQDYKTPFEFRRAVIRVLREIDIVMTENNFQSFQLNYIIAASFIPSERQLNLHLDQLFDFHPDAIQINETKEKVSLLVSKADNQTCYFISPKDDDQFSKQMSILTLSEFYQLTGESYTFRESS